MSTLISMPNSKFQSWTDSNLQFLYLLQYNPHRFQHNLNGDQGHLLRDINNKTFRREGISICFYMFSSQEHTVHTKDIRMVRNCNKFIIFLVKQYNHDFILAISFSLNSLYLDQNLVYGSYCQRNFLVHCTTDWATPD